MALEGHLGTLFVDIKARNKMKGEIGRIGNQMRAAGRVMTTYITLPIVAAGAMAVKTAAEFETSMRQIAVATGAPQKELRIMEKLAIKLGADTIYSANEAAEAMLELAKSGINPTQIRAGALKETLNLAAASGLDMANSAVVMGTTLNAFHLPATRAKEAVDALAGAANASSAEVSDITLALQQVSAMAYQSGLSIQETSAVLAVFADAGIRGSDAGTSFKVFLQRLNPVSGKAKDLMTELKMSFYKANGEMKPMVGIVKELQEKLGGMTQKQRMSTMQILFGTDAIRAAAVLYDQGVDGMKKYIKETSEVGAASKMAAARMGGIAGAIEQLRGSVETAGLVIGKLLAPSIRLVAGWLKKMFNAFSALPKPVQKMIILFAALLAAVGPLLLVLGLMASAITVLMSHALVPFFLVMGKVILVIAAIAAIGYVLSKMWKYLVPVMKPVLAAFGHLWDSLKELYSLIKPLLLPVLKVLAGLVGGAILIAFAGLALVLAVIVNVIAGVIKVFVGLGKVIYGVGEILWGFITGNRKLMAKGMKDMTEGFALMGEGAKNVVVDSAKAIYDIIKGTVEGIGGMLGDSMDKAKDEADKGGKETGKKYSEGHAKETEKGRKKEEDAREKAHDERKKQMEKQGEDEGAAYIDGMEGGLLGRSALMGGGKKTKGERADEAEWKAHLARRKAYWKAFVKGDFEGARKQLEVAKKFQKKADMLRDKNYKDDERKQKQHQTKQIGLFREFGRFSNRILRANLNTQSGIFLLSRKRRLALQKAFQKREQFAQRNHNTTMAAIFRFFKNQVAALDRLFNTQAANRRKTKNAQERAGTRWHWTRILFIVGMALFGPAGLLNLHLIFGRRLMVWLRGAFARQRATTRNHWTIAYIITRLGIIRILNILKIKITQFSRWLIRVPRMFYNRIMQGSGWLYRAGRRLVNRMIKGVKDRIKGILNAGKQSAKATLKGYRKGGKGAGGEGKKAGDNIRKGFKKGTKKGKKDGEKAGKDTGTGFKKGSIKGQLKAGVKTAKEFIKGLKKKLGIRSPSTEARKLGVSVHRGFTQGVAWKSLKEKSADNMGKVTKAMRNKLQKFSKWLRGLPKHWKNLLLLNAHYLGEAGRQLAKVLIGAVKERLGVKSPSKEFERIGRFMIMGLIKGLNQKGLLEIMDKHLGGFEAFAIGVWNTLDKNKERGWEWLSKLLGGHDAQQLYEAIGEKYSLGKWGESGALAGVEMTPGIPLLEAIFAWATGQLPEESHSITSRYREGAGSWHGRDGGRAIDIAPGSDALAQILAQLFGVKKGEWGLGMIDNEFGELIWQAPDHYDHIHLAIIAISDFLRGLATGGGGDVWGQVKAAAANKWPGSDQLNALKELISRESGFDPQAQNPNSTAWGLFQFLDMHWKPGGYLPQGKDSTLAQQITGGLRYISDRYGNPKAALDFHDRNNWYEGGGLVSATLHSGERVLTQQQNRWFTALAKPLSALSRGGKMGILPMEVKVAMPAGTTFKIVNLREGIVEVVDEGVYRHVEKTIGIEEWVDK